MKSYTFYKGGVEYQTSNLSAFCREHGLQRRHIDEVIAGKRKSHHGWSKAVVPDDQLSEGMTVRDTLVVAGIAAKAQGDQAYEAVVAERVEQVRQGKPLVLNREMKRALQAQGIEDDDPGLLELREKGIVE